jgi:CRP/FNR family cyclic AMP-dependent transcriptional regulator
MYNVDQIDLIRRCTFGAELETGDCEVLGKATEIRELEEGEVLFSEGAADQALYIVILGKLGLVKGTAMGEDTVLHMLHEGDLAGELAFVDGTPHSVTAKALTRARVLTLDRRRFESLVETHPKVVYDVMRSIVKRVHTTLRRLNLQYIELTNYITKSHGRY